MAEDLKVVHRRKRGSAVVETALMTPWLVFLFVGILDFGFYSYAAISTQEAARVAAIQYASDGANACTAALGALQGLPNVNIGSGCAASRGAITASLPVAVVTQTPSAITCPDSGYTYSSSATCVEITVTYQTIPMIPIPGLMGQMTLSRAAQARVIQP